MMMMMIMMMTTTTTTTTKMMMMMMITITVYYYYYYLLFFNHPISSSICKLPIRSNIYNCTFNNTNKVSIIIINFIVRWSIIFSLLQHQKRKQRRITQAPQWVASLEAQLSLSLLFLVFGGALRKRPKIPGGYLGQNRRH